MGFKDIACRTPKVTVITPTYNRAELIGKTIESVLNQDFKDFEYLILDDGSTDNTRKVIEPYLKDKRVRYLYNSNRGEAETVNLGWRLAKGDYFVQVNSDDPVLPTLFGEMVKVLDRNKNVVVVYPDFYFIDANDKIVQSNRNTNWNFLEALSYFSCNAATAGTFIRRTAFSNWTKIKNKKFKYISDVDMYWKMALVGDFYYLPKFLANWRVHAGGISNERYKSIPEVEVWFKEYFSQPDLPEKVLRCKEKTRKSIYAYYIGLLEQSSSDDKNKEINRYRRKLGLPVFHFNNLQVGDNDLVGNKFNGHDLHLYLRDRNIDSKHLVWNKESDDENTYVIAGEKTYRESMRQNALDVQKKYSLDSISNPITYDILYNELFLNTDVVHFHLIHNFIFDIQMLPIMSGLKPIVWTLHDPWAFGGHCIHHYDCKKWETHCEECPYLDDHFKLDKDNSALNFAVKKMAIENSSLDVIVASKWMERKVRKSPIFQGKRIHLVPFGVNHDVFKLLDKSVARDELKIPKDAFVVAFRCDYSGFKGMDYIEYVLENLSLKRKIYVLALANTFNKKIDGVIVKNYGWVKNDELLSKIYNAADMFLAPSKAESFGMMVVEAMSCGTLPIVLDGTALTDTVNAPKCGVSVVRDKDEYLKTVKYFIEHKTERIRRSTMCLEFASKTYNKNRYINNIIQIYKGAIKRHNMGTHEELLLSQLKKHMATISQSSCAEPDGLIKTTLMEKVIPKRFRRKIKDFVLISFYKIDKVFPKAIRSVVKARLIKYRCIRKHLIK